MRKFVTISVIVVLVGVFSAFAQPNIWINEFHYDNTGTDVGEFVEVAVPATYTNLSAVTLTLYNGNGGAPYGTPTTLDLFTQGSTSLGFTLYSLDFPSNGIQNGAPDGFSLDSSGVLIQFLSYEGSFTAVGGPADGILSTDVGVSEPGSDPIGLSLQLIGSGTQYSDFTWSGPITATEGFPNTDQSLPITLSSFTARAGDRIVTLHWVTESEKDNVGFEIMRSNQEDGNYDLLSSYVSNEALKGQLNSNQQAVYKFVDKLVGNDITYWYKLVDVDLNGVRTFHGPISATPHAVGNEIVNTSPGNLPQDFALQPNYPNPFNPNTTLSFDIPQLTSGNVDATLYIYNSLGQQVKVLYQGKIAAGNYKVEWDGTNESGSALPSGIYYATLRADYFTKTIKMMYMK